MSTHIPYEVYSNLLDQDYQLGKSDCFTIINSVLDQSFGIKMPNYARPEGFHRDELNLMPRIAAEPFLHHRPALDIKDLQAGDILCFAVTTTNVNHVGIYLGNNLFLHQMYDSKPREENIDQKWFRRLKYILYHEDVTQEKTKFDVLDLMPNFKKVMNYVE